MLKYKNRIKNKIFFLISHKNVNKKYDKTIYMYCACI